MPRVQVIQPTLSNMTHLATPTVIVADPFPAFAAGLVSLLNENTSLCVESSTHSNLLDIVNHPDIAVIVLDIQFAGFNSGFDLISKVATINPKAAILVSASEDYMPVADLVYKTGAAGLILKESPLNEYLTAINTIMTGDIYIREDVARQLAKTALIGGPLLSKLTPKEQQCFLLMAKGYTNLEIAGELGFSTKPPQNKQVFSLCKQVEEKLGVQRQADVTRLAIRLRLLDA